MQWKGFSKPNSGRHSTRKSEYGTLWRLFVFKITSVKVRDKLIEREKEINVPSIWSGGKEHMADEMRDCLMTWYLYFRIHSSCVVCKNQFLFDGMQKIRFLYLSLTGVFFRILWALETIYQYHKMSIKWLNVGALMFHTVENKTLE